jgi:hypothetical protein
MNNIINNNILNINKNTLIYITSRIDSSFLTHSHTNPSKYTKYIIYDVSNLKYIKKLYLYSLQQKYDTYVKITKRLYYFKKYNLYYYLDFNSKNIIKNIPNDCDMLFKDFELQNLEYYLESNKNKNIIYFADDITDIYNYKNCCFLYENIRFSDSKVSIDFICD